MNYFAKKNTLIWIIIVLFAINVASITTIIIFMGSHNNQAPHIIRPNNETPRFLQKELGLSSEQKQDFKLMHLNFRDNSKIIINELDSLRFEMMNELSLDNPDSVKLDKIADEIGLKHGQLKKETIKHFIEMRKSCENGEQRRMLSRIYRSMREYPERNFRRNNRQNSNIGYNKENRNYRNRRNHNRN